MSKIGLIDVDGHSNYPNLALMKISAYHKQMGDNLGYMVWHEATCGIDIK